MSSSDHPTETQPDHSPANDYMEPEHKDEDQSDEESESSSVEWEHEPFESFQIKVLDFALTLWNGLDRDDIEVHRMHGGSYNRVIGISIKAAPEKVKHVTSIVQYPSFSSTIHIGGIPIETDSEQDNSMDYILRIPRPRPRFWCDVRLDHDVAALLYVRRLENIPVPEIVAFDETSKNTLGEPYMVQRRLPGTDLNVTFPDLDHNQKIRVATELGQIFNRMLSKKNTAAGKLILPANVAGADQQIDEGSLEPLFLIESPTTDQLQPNLTTKELLSRVFEERKVHELRRYPSGTVALWLMDQFTTMAKELHEDGWFGGNDISLCHLDFEPRNIMVDATRDAAQPIISGILDWDSAVLAPSFMSCAPPFWIWAWPDDDDDEDDDDEDERTANDVPPTEEGRFLKKSFEEAAGPEYVRYAYPSAYRLARRLVRFAIDGMHSNEQYKEANAMLKEWTELRGGSMVQLEFSKYNPKAPVTGAIKLKEPKTSCSDEVLRVSSSTSSFSLS